MKNQIILLFLAIIMILPSLSYAQTCAVYFTGIGCPHCAKSDPVLFKQMVNQNNFVIIEYELYQKSENAEMILDYDSQYHSGFGVPLLIFDNGDILIGDRTIINEIQNIINKDSGFCPLSTGLIDFENLEITQLAKNPNIWANNRVLIADGKYGNDTILRELLTTDNISESIKKTAYSVIKPEPIPYSGGSVEFNNAVKINGWVFQWNENGVNISQNQTNQTNGGGVDPAGGFSEQLTLPKLLSLAAVDAVNPCALAVLTILLVSILTYNPEKRKNVLLAGLAFSISVFIMYLFYGLVIIKFFQIIQALTSIRLLLYTILGVAAIILGILNIKDFIKYTPGGLGTEMPMKLRPLMKKLISGVTSPKGAFIVGLLVTIFLLPCTIGPYVIAGGILSAFEIIQTLPWLLLYNLIFILPMLAITGIIYLGMARVEDVSKWKDNNIRYLHLIAGAIILFLGIAMILGLI